MTDAELQGTAGPQVSPAGAVDDFVNADRSGRGWIRDWSQGMYLYSLGAYRYRYEALSVGATDEEDLDAYDIYALVVEAVE